MCNVSFDFSLYQGTEVGLNLMICDIVCYFLSSSVTSQLQYGNQLVKYIVDVINDETITLTNEQIKIMLNITQQLLNSRSMDPIRSKGMGQ